MHNTVIKCRHCRVNAYIRNGWDTQLIDPDRPLQSPDNTSIHQSLSLPTDGWEDIKQAYSSPNQGSVFTNAQIINYFVTRTADDGLPVGDFKSVNESALNLY